MSIGLLIIGDCIHPELQSSFTSPCILNRDMDLITVSLRGHALRGVLTCHMMRHKIFYKNNPIYSQCSCILVYG